MKGSNRRRSRELALQTLYACEVGDCSDFEKTLDGLVREDDAGAGFVRYARLLVQKTRLSLPDIDDTIRLHAANWDLKRMTAIDRNILRMAVAELWFFEEVPFKVVIDEAVELAKKFGTDDSGKFVNGVIDSIHRETPLKKNGRSG
jgi:transcription antitermination protein NusB